LLCDAVCLQLVFIARVIDREFSPDATKLRGEDVHLSESDGGYSVVRVRTLQLIVIL
jgi:hypothetical protein